MPELPLSRGDRTRGQATSESWQRGLLTCCTCSDTWEQRFLQGSLENPHPWGAVKSSSSQSHSGVPDALCGTTPVVST